MTALGASNTEISSNLWTSSNSGGSWELVHEANESSIPPPFFSIASSSDGDKLAAVHLEGDVWTSSDQGKTWTKRTPDGTNGTSFFSPGEPQLAVNIASSSDGTRLAVAVYRGNVWLSDDSGATWNEKVVGGPNKKWTHVTSNADGTRLAAMAGSVVASSSLPSHIYTSSDAGVTWTNSSEDIGSGKKWQTITSSPDGTLAASAIDDTSSGTSTLWIYA